MIQRDYLLRQLHHFVQTLAQVMVRKKSGQYDEAIGSIQAAGEQFFGLDFGRPHQVTYAELLAPLQVAGAFDPERGALTAELLRQQGDLFALMERPDEAHDSYQLALPLYLDVYLHGGLHQSPDTRARIDALLEALDGPEQAPPPLPQLLPYYEATGRYAEAEDALFTRLEAAQAAGILDEALYEEGRQFFQRLRRRTAAELEAGGLPFAEVGEGIRAFRRFFPRR